MATWNDVIARAAQELGIVAGGETLSADDANVLLGIANELIDEWNADRGAVYCDTFNTYVLTPNLNPHTIGPTGATWTAAIRPVDIVAANIVVTTASPNYRTPVNIRDAEWWMANSVRAVTSTLPTDLFYRTNWVNGDVYLWRVPTAAYSLELQTRVLLSDVTLVTTFSLPPAYRKAMTLTIAENAADSFGRAMPASLPNRAAQARSRLWANNTQAPRITTRDYGMSGPRRGTKLNWLNREIV